MVEKPILLSSEHFYKVEKIANNNNVTFYECFMHRYGLLYKEFMAIYNSNVEKIKLIEIDFCIPSVPDNTFRDKNDLKSSVIYDIGCYPFSLLNDLNIINKKINIKNINNLGDFKKEKFNIEVIANSIKINIKFGIDNSYSNSVIIKKSDGEIIKFEPFFYGRKKEKRIVYNNNTFEKIRIIEDNDLFKKMFNHSIENSLISQKKRNQIMLRNILDLNTTINQYIKFF